MNPRIPPDISKQELKESLVVIVLEDDRTTSELLCLILRKNGLTPMPCYSLAEANEALHGEVRISGMLIDLFLPDGDGIEALRNARRIYKNLPCFVLTGKETVESVVAAIKAGAENYLVKPFEPASLVNALKSSISIYKGLPGGPQEESITPQGMNKWKSPKMRQAMDIAKDAAKTLSSVVITGGECTGKRRFAQFIHSSGSLKKSVFTTINLRSLSPSQIEMELFGAPLSSLGDEHLRGKGKLEKCRRQTLYIENLDCLHPPAQDRLLSWLIEQQTSDTGKLGACRLICASSADILAAVKEGAFRKELWFALSVYHIEVPSLAERDEDIPMLCENIITRICVTRKLRRPTITRKALEMLMDHNWPGNLSELYNSLEHAVSRTQDGLIGPEDFPVMSRQSMVGTPYGSLHLGGASIDEINKLTLVAALEACGGNRRRAAQRLKISLRTIYNMIERYELPRKAKNSKASSQSKSDPESPRTNE